MQLGLDGVAGGRARIDFEVLRENSDLCRV
jgi:hypothetical protein